jgi:hypothetical protein
MLAQTISYDQDLLNRFEEGLDPYDPEHSRIPAHVLGYGEMSTVMTISGANPDLVFKRMPMFYSTAELEPYLELYDSYLHHLIAAGINVVPAAVTFVVPSQGNIVIYIVQEKLDCRTLVNKAIHTFPDEEIENLFAAILSCIGQVFAYNDAHEGKVALGFDAQMSNWAIAGYEEAADHLPDPVELIYIDTSSPLLRLNDQEQLDPELFLRSAPSFLRWVIRLLFLDDVMTRYYSRRQVIIDVLANLYKEKRTDMIPRLLVIANTFLEKHIRSTAYKPLTQEEIAGYYKEDARIWSVYLAFRRLDRWFHHMLGRPYPYVLPGHVNR